MSKKDKRIDAYIRNARPFARPVLSKLRELIHKGIPEVEETIKWGMPFFDYKGNICSFASFNEHAVFGLWKYKLIKDTKGFLQENANRGGEAMGNFGRIKSIKDLPPDTIIIDYLRQARELNEKGIRLPVKKKVVKTELKIPDYFRRALKKNKEAEKTFDNFPYSHKKEYLEWITEAKTEATKMKRLKTAVEWMSQGKPRNWKYR